MKNTSPIGLLILGYLAYTLVGWFVLSLPWFRLTEVSGIDALFIAASAVSTTGLVTVDPGSTFTTAGQVVILLLIQVGGIGYMTFGSFVIVATRHKMSRQRVAVTRAAFALPEDFGPAHFVWNVVRFTILVETAGTLMLWWAFSLAGVERPLWMALFHAISAFCTAGFSLFPDSLERFAGDPWVTLLVSALSYAGAMGFIVMVDVWNKVSGRRERLHFTSRVILRVTVGFSVLGTLAVYNMDPQIRAMGTSDGLLAAFFQVMSATTTVGFNTIPISSLPAAVIMLLYFAMIFGASPSGTGGGLKSTTLAALIGLVRSTLKRRKQVSLHGRALSNGVIQQASASLAFYMGVLLCAVTLLLTLEDGSLDAVLFEAISALGTVWLSAGITGDLSGSGKAVLVLLMFMGRVGILSFGIAVSMEDEEPARDGKDDLAL
jgi:trk system potassium uptake protein TrkH